jgi:hypothetical protein|tara:strand:- start:256 stop:357 length:102 start_codon:yes stop_codon:yes gene_type:complete
VVVAELVVQHLLKQDQQVRLVRHQEMAVKVALL